jgi:hypothetical protein
MLCEGLLLSSKQAIAGIVTVVMMRSDAASQLPAAPGSRFSHRCRLYWTLLLAVSMEK